MLVPEDYEFLVFLLRERPVLFPRKEAYDFNDGFRPQHRQCQLTAIHLFQSQGLDMISGICWLDVHGKLYPWAHVVNLQGDELVDYSHGIAEPSFGFSPMTNDEVEQRFNRITAAYDIEEFDDRVKPGWGDPLAQLLSDEWYVRLRDNAGRR